MICSVYQLPINCPLTAHQLPINCPSTAHQLPINCPSTAHQLLINSSTNYLIIIAENDSATSAALLVA
jgi:hypothetical protein